MKLSPLPYSLFIILSFWTINLFGQDTDRTVFEQRVFIGNGTSGANDAIFDVVGSAGSQVVGGDSLSSIVKFFDVKTNGGGFRFLVHPNTKSAVLLGGRNNTDFGFATRTNQLNYERVRIKNNGNVGIGILEPARKLHVNDVMRLEPRNFPPSNPSEGDMYMDGNNHKLMVYDGTDWQSCW